MALPRLDTSSEELHGIWIICCRALTFSSNQYDEGSARCRWRSRSPCRKRGESVWSDWPGHGALRYDCGSGRGSCAWPRGVMRTPVPVLLALAVAVCGDSDTPEPSARSNPPEAQQPLASDPATEPGEEAPRSLRLRTPRSSVGSMGNQRFRVARVVRLSNSVDIRGWAGVFGVPEGPRRLCRPGCGWQGRPLMPPEGCAAA